MTACLVQNLRRRRSEKRAEHCCGDLAAMVKPCQIMKLSYCRGATFVVGCLLTLLWPRSSAQAAQPSQWNPRGPGGGGALFAPGFSPFSPGEMYLACDMSEVFHSTNYGQDWSVVDFRQIEGGRQAIVQFTSDSNIRYSIDYS